MRAVAVLSLALLGAGVACGAFGGDSSGSGSGSDSGSGPVEDAAAPLSDAAIADTGTAVDATIRCGSLACPATEKCCLPLDGTADAGCIARTDVCAAGFGELLCSSPTACASTEVCCVTAERNAGQTAFDITRSFCVTASKCPDQNLQHAMCDLGSNGQCADGKACLPYLHDVNDQPQNLDVNPSGYATCQ